MCDQKNEVAEQPKAQHVQATASELRPDFRRALILRLENLRHEQAGIEALLDALPAKLSDQANEAMFLLVMKSGR